MSPPIIPKVAVARWRSSPVAINLNSHSKAVRRIAKCGMQNVRPSCDYHHIGGIVAGSTPGLDPLSGNNLGKVVRTHMCLCNQVSFMDDVIFARRLRLLDVAARLRQ